MNRDRLSAPVSEVLKRKIIIRIVRRCILCLAIYAVLYYALFYRYSLEYYFEKAGPIITAVFLTVILLIPYFATGIHSYVRDSSYEGTVIKVRRLRELKPWHGGPNMHEFFTREQCIAVRALIRLDNGEVLDKLIRRYDFDDLAQSLCQVGDRVRHVKGAPYTQIYGGGRRHDIDCVWCGYYSDKRYAKCERCGVPVLPWIDVPMPEMAVREPLREEEAEVKASEMAPREASTAYSEASVKESEFTYAHRPVRSADEQEYEIGEVTPTPEFGTYKRKVDPFDFAGLFGVSLAAMTVTGYISSLFSKMLEGDVNKWIFTTVVAGIIPTVVSIYYMRSYPSTHYRTGGRFPAWLMQASLFIIPAELLRMLISGIRILGSLNMFGSLFSPMCFQWWYLYHMLPSERLEQMESGIFLAEDYGVYYAVAIPAMLLRIAILFAGYYYFWQKYEKERAVMFNSKNGRK